MIKNAYKVNILLKGTVNDLNYSKGQLNITNHLYKAQSTILILCLLIQ